MLRANGHGYDLLMRQRRRQSKISDEAMRESRTHQLLAFVAADVLPRLQKEARVRQRVAGQRYGEQHPKEEVPPKTAEPLDAPHPLDQGGEAVFHAAALVGVGIRNP